VQHPHDLDLFTGCYKEDQVAAMPRRAKARMQVIPGRKASRPFGRRAHHPLQLGQEEQGALGIVDGDEVADLDQVGARAAGRITRRGTCQP
jgi:hypothetical protein